MNRPTLEEARAEFDRVSAIGRRLALILDRDINRRQREHFQGLHDYLVRAVEEAQRSAFCPKCGYELTPMMLCPSCGVRYDDWTVVPYADEDDPPLATAAPAAGDELGRIRRTMGAYADSDLASLTETMVAQRRLLALAIAEHTRTGLVSIDAIALARSILADEPPADAGDERDALARAWAAKEMNARRWRGS